MEKKIIAFEEIVSEVLGTHGNKWNSRRFIDVNMLAESMFWDAEYDKYMPTHDEIEEVAVEVFDSGMEDPCIVAIRKNEDDMWKILWGNLNGVFDTNGPVLFNVTLDRTCDRTDDIFLSHKYVKDDEYMLSWTHHDYNVYAKEGYYAVYKKCPLGDSVRHEISPMPAHKLSFREMQAKLRCELTLDALRSVPPVTEYELKHGYKVMNSGDQPGLLMIDGKILCNSKNGVRLPYLFNAEGYMNDGYVASKPGDEVLREYEWDTDGGIGVRYRKGYVEDWR